MQSFYREVERLHFECIQLLMLLPLKRGFLVTNVPPQYKGFISKL